MIGHTITTLYQELGPIKTPVERSDLLLSYAVYHNELVRGVIRVVTPLFYGQSSGVSL